MRQILCLWAAPTNRIADLEKIEVFAGDFLLKILPYPLYCPILRTKIDQSDLVPRRQALKVFAQCLLQLPEAIAGSNTERDSRGRSHWE